MQLSRRNVLLLGAVFGMNAIPGIPAFAQAGKTPKRGGVLNSVAVGEPTTLVPLLDSNTRTRVISTKILEGLVRFDETFNPQPVLATSWSISSDGLRYTFNLRHGVKWHDGKEFTSEDVRFSLLAFKRVGPRGRITFARVTDVETPDPFTAIVVLSQPTPFLLRALTGGETPILAAHSYPTEDYAASKNGQSPIGTGPFVFEEWKRGGYVKLRKNPDYWQPGLPYLDGVVARFIGDGAAASIAIETGEAHLSTDISLVDIDRLRQNPEIAVDIYTDSYLNNAQIFEFNLENPILAKRQVRQALAHAIDRNFIVEAIFFGAAKPAASTIPTVFTSYNDEAPFQYPFDLETASQLLDAAGFPKNNDGSRFSLRLAFLPGDTFKKTAEYLRSTFGKLGIKVDILDGDLGTYIKRVYYERGFDINLNGISRLFDPTAGVQRLYWSDGIKNIAPYVNAAHYDNPQIDGLFRAAAVEQDDAKRAGQFKKIQAIAGEDLPNLALVALPTVVARSKAAQSLVTTIDVTSSDFATAWLDV
ncbi:ABC transporter substrate-binding protein [Agrobacterium rhizogenes]|uniref:ABC transporter substrate-binding protein n=1 Tax=Rhizobium rhizogenes TaxID=359 RepID=UPI00157488FB|nr:ABC transporter substrate-binding protein [Rhizobium rhizogenes]NTF52926.1 ABC transporter substrate-binding protein [Rhizobium rhizogenes]NTH10136.1 ABC transporter substrate-binding protein [Rhizobium rhizogenes]NTH42688.1 ABC transporter substrate-binding protein [Rhizobium rhizogenes]NTI06695.1 ABC transporter substrate-binding protein [Rhizobium rhizogenes]NTI13500.1 ABC transporter substrate-binding protein [Rhizobium rhizogenes]